MKTYTPIIYWYDKNMAITAVDIQPTPVPATKHRDIERQCERYYKLATVGIETEVRLWEYCFVKEEPSLQVDFIANLKGHDKSVNCCKFSPNGTMLATGDVDGSLIIWEYSNEELIVEPSDDMEIPPNKENWKINRRVRVRHDSDINCLCWSPDSKYIATGSSDNSIAVHDGTTGSRFWGLRNFRNFPVGLSWDPHNKYVICCSTDRRLDIIDAKKGHRMRNVMTVTGLETTFGAVKTSSENTYKLFHDSQLVTFTRAIDFSPCGSLLVVPAAHLEVADSNIYGTFIFRRSDFDLCRPFAILPSTKPTVFVRCSPIVYKLLDDEQNFSGLPHRVIFAVLTREAVTFYDSQLANPIMFIDNLHYDVISSISWSPDGKNIVLSSFEGLNTFITDFEHKFGERAQIPEMSEDEMDVLKKAKKGAEEKSAKKKKGGEKDGPETPKATKAAVEVKTPKESKTPKQPKTPKGAKKVDDEVTPKKTVEKDGATSILKFFTPEATAKPKQKKRIETVMLE